MFNAFIANLTACTIGVHALLGCCWHHEHAGPQAGILASLAALQHDGGLHAAKCPGGEQHKPNVCREGKCDFIRLVNKKLTQTPSVSFSSFAQPLAGADRAVNGERSDRQLGDADFDPPPLRLHLVKQVLLI